jgi:hypothetical protein
MGDVMAGGNFTSLRVVVISEPSGHSAVAMPAIATRHTIQPALSSTSSEEPHASAIAWVTYTASHFPARCSSRYLRTSFCTASAG